MIDLDTGDQPIYNEDRSVAVVLNGEIYNYRELRDELERRGHTLRPRNGDTEVIAHLYEEHGVDCVRRLHGMFAFALWDARRQQLLLARDRVGKKPLLYCERDGVLSFASEMGALLGDDEIPREVDHEALDAYLTLGYVPAPLTRPARRPQAAAGAHAHSARRPQRAAALLEARLRGEARGRRRVEELCERMRAGLRAATKRRMIADVPLGAFLSGGIDSSAVVAAMARAVGRARAHVLDRLRPPGVRRAAPRAPGRRAVRDRSTRSSRSAPMRSRSLPKIVRHYGEPFADSSAIPSFYLAELTRRHVTVALNGDGGDESFGGYTRYVANALAGRLDRCRRPAARPSPALRRAAAGGRPRRQPAKQGAALRGSAGARRPGSLRELHVVVRPRSAPRALHARVRRRRRARRVSGRSPHRGRAARARASSTRCSRSTSTPTWSAI